MTNIELTLVPWTIFKTPLGRPASIANSARCTHAPESTNEWRTKERIYEYHRQRVSVLLKKITIVCAPKLVYIANFMHSKGMLDKQIQTTFPCTTLKEDDQNVTYLKLKISRFFQTHCIL